MGVKVKIMPGRKGDDLPDLRCLGSLSAEMKLTDALVVAALEFGGDQFFGLRSLIQV